VDSVKQLDVSWSEATVLGFGRGPCGGDFDDVDGWDPLGVFVGELSEHLGSVDADPVGGGVGSLVGGLGVSVASINASMPEPHCAGALA
jgi:hypothetical protein